VAFDPDCYSVEVRLSRWSTNRVVDVPIKIFMVVPLSNSSHWSGCMRFTANLFIHTRTQSDPAPDSLVMDPSLNSEGQNFS